jgi:hypothetical protein
MDREKMMKKYLPQLAQGPDIDSLANRLGKNIIELETAQANLNIFADHIIKLSEEKENLQQQVNVLKAQLEQLGKPTINAEEVK